MKYDLLCCLACLILAATAAQLAYLWPRSVSLPPSLGAWRTLSQGLYASEQFSDHSGRYRWTNGNALLALPNPGGQFIVRIGLAGGPNRTSTITIGDDQRQSHITVAPSLRYYSLLLPPQPSPHMLLVLNSDTFRLASDQRLLGVIVSGVTLRSGGSAPWKLALAWAVAGAVLYILARMASLTPSLALALIAAANALCGMWVGSNWQAPTFLTTLGTGAWTFGAVLAGVAMGRFVLSSQAIRRYASRAVVQLQATAISVSRYVARIASHPIVAASSIGLCASIAGYRLFVLINTYAVNMLFWDQWDLYGPLFTGRGAWAMMLHQHGPHRQGLGGLVLYITTYVAGLDSRVDAFVIGAIFGLAAAASLALKRLLLNRLTTVDALLPLMFLSIIHSEGIITVPNPAHGALPLLLVMLYALAWGLPWPLTRYSAIVALNFGLVFTGFGIFMGLITPVLLAIDLFWKVLWQRTAHVVVPAIALGSSLLAIYCFSIGYKFNPVIDCFVFPHPRPWEYPWFMGLMFAYFFGLGFAEAPVVITIFGLILLISLVGIALYHAAIVIRQGMEAKPISRTIVMLIGFSILFSANSAVGRVCSGVGASQASRYMALVVPVFVGLYLHLLTIRSTPLRAVAVGLVLLALLPLPQRVDEVAQTAFYALGKQRWKACYLAVEQPLACSQLTSFDIYPAPSLLRERLNYLKAHRLNLFNGE